jgi:hypothetical protein
VDDAGAQIRDLRAIELIGWVPPDDWEERILSGAVTDGLSITADFETLLDQADAGLAMQIRSLVQATRTAYPQRISTRIPWSVLVLACL